MKKYLLTLILILCLTFPIIGNSAWLDGYDQRVKLTIDHTKVDEDLTWFPITVYLTAAQGEEIFTEFDDDEDFDRVAFVFNYGSLGSPSTEYGGIDSTQGLTTDGTYVYETDNTTIYKKNFAGDLIDSNNDLWDGETITSNGGLFYHSDGYIYMASGTYVEDGNAFVFKIDPADLSTVYKWDIGASMDYGVNAISYLNGYWYIGETSCADNPPASIKVFNSDFEYVKTAWTSPYNMECGFQDATVYNNKIYVTAHAYEGVYVFEQNADLTLTKAYVMENKIQEGIFYYNNLFYYSSASNLVKASLSETFNEQMKVDYELFDVSEQKGIYHMSKNTFVVSSTSDTDFFIYYDNDADHNTTNIGMSGGTAAQGVWNDDFKAVYHMNDVIVNYDTQYEADVEPDSDGWVLGGSDYASISTGILTIDTSADNNFICNYYKTPDINFDTGFYFKIKTQLVSGRVTIEVRDGTQNERLHLNIWTDKVDWYDGASHIIKTFDTTDDYHIYEFYIKGTTMYFYIDGVLEDTGAVWGSSGGDNIQFGDTVVNQSVNARIDYFYYALGVTDNPVNAVLDSTSNNNDGTKKGANEPNQITGLNGAYSQEFDGADDYITIPANVTLDIDTDYTLTMVVFSDAIASERYFYSAGYNNNNSLLWFKGGGGNLSVIERDNLGANVNYSVTDAKVTANTWQMLTYSRDKSATDTYVYIDGTLVQTYGMSGLTIVDTATNDHTIGWARPRDKAGTNFDGKQGEVRLSPSFMRSAAWLKGTYNSLWDTLLTYGSEKEALITANAVFFGTNF